MKLPYSGKVLVARMFVALVTVAIVTLGAKASTVPALSSAADLLVQKGPEFAALLAMVVFAVDVQAKNATDKAVTKAVEEATKQ